MSSYHELFKQLRADKRIGRCPFAVIGDPTPEAFLQRIDLYLKAGAEMLELGLPFSDPVADGPTIQQADERALRAGMTPRKALSLIKKIRSRTAVPIGVLAYANSVFRYGTEEFYRELKKSGATSLLIADLPPEEATSYVEAAQNSGIDQIFIVSEATSPERLRLIEKLGSGFLYLVSTLGVTGARTALPRGLSTTIKRLKKACTLPLAVGFGISSAEHISEIKRAGADAAIIGSALVGTPLTQLPKQLKKLFA
ncbi:tryptophan synthase subunit alpha [Candidatus Peregrinibacteria bacterium CG_4_9_14_0_2_um_filter_53_11]|nr:MAG: tryptophan synthase subunit alpha [Candidatus Peregrinibacteria bacterium CG_4_9_14_0_2_um_filter_53_11]